MLFSSHTWLLNAIGSIIIFAAGRASTLFSPRRIDSGLWGRIHWKRRRFRNQADSDCGDIMNSLSYVKAIYGKLLVYFDSDKPYLNPDLTINDVAKKLLTNKMYVAKAIKTFASTNFPQFVNGYRIRHAIHLFQQDISLRVGELAYKSGFNSTAAFNIAFKTNMNMTPGEWCRRYKLRQ